MKIGWRRCVPSKRAAEPLFAGKREDKKRGRSHLRLVECYICPGGNLCSLSLGIREKFPVFLFSGFRVVLSVMLLFYFFGIDAKETVDRVLTPLAEVVLLVLAFAAFRDMGGEKVGEMNLPEIGIDLSLVKEFLDVPWSIFHESYLLIHRYFISIPYGIQHTRPGLVDRGFSDRATGGIRSLSR